MLKNTLIDKPLKVLREAGQYIKSQRGSIIVVSFPAICFEKTHESFLQSALSDVSLLHTLGIKIIICFEASQVLHHGRVADAKCSISEHDFLEFSRTLGAMRYKIESILSRSQIPNTGKQRQQMVQVHSGNFVIGRPKGIINGVDFGFSGLVRGIHAEAIMSALNQNAIVLISPIGHSPSGESFVLDYLEIGLKCASAIRASKLIYWADLAINIAHQSHAVASSANVVQANDLLSLKQVFPRELSVAQAQQLLKERTLPAQLNAILESAIQACQRNIDRCYVLDYQMEGALLLELLTRDGVGTMITENDYDAFRQATIEDISGIIALIEPFEKQGVLVRRSRERLEQEIQYFWIMLRDDLIIGCGAMYPYLLEKMGEIACLTVHPDYRGSGRADRLLAALEKAALEQGLTHIFALTTHTAHWFIEREFNKASIESLPILKQSLYNYQRRSQVLIKAIAC